MSQNFNQFSEYKKKSIALIITIIICSVIFYFVFLVKTPSNNVYYAENNNESLGVKDTLKQSWQDIIDGFSNAIDIKDQIVDDINNQASSSAEVNLQ